MQCYFANFVKKSYSTATLGFNNYCARWMLQHHPMPDNPSITPFRLRST